MEKNLDLEETRPSVAEPERKEATVMSRESVDSFLSFLESSGRTKQTIDTYRRCLSHLLSFLPDDKKIGADTLRQWQEAMRTEGRTVESLNIHIFTALFPNFFAYRARKFPAFIGSHQFKQKQ